MFSKNKYFKIISWIIFLFVLCLEERSKLAKLGDAIAISKSETMNRSLTDRGRRYEMLSHIKKKYISWVIFFF